MKRSRLEGQERPVSSGRCPITIAVPAAEDAGVRVFLDADAALTDRDWQVRQSAEDLTQQ